MHLNCSRSETVRLVSDSRPLPPLTALSRCSGHRYLLPSLQQARRQRLQARTWRSRLPDRSGFPALAGAPNVECIFDVVVLVVAPHGRRARPATVEVAAAALLRRTIGTGG